nr:hypothetical protein CFP56_76855 [Quercus suber]
MYNLCERQESSGPPRLLFQVSTCFGPPRCSRRNGYPQISNARRDRDLRQNFPPARRRRVVAIDFEGTLRCLRNVHRRSRDTHIVSLDDVACTAGKLLLKTVSLASFSVQASPAFTGNLGSKPTVCNSTIGKGHTQQSRHPESDKLVSFVPKQTRRAVVHWDVGRVLWSFEAWARLQCFAAEAKLGNTVRLSVMYTCWKRVTLCEVPSNRVTFFWKASYAKGDISVAANPSMDQPVRELKIQEGGEMKD